MATPVRTRTHQGRRRDRIVQPPRGTRGRRARRRRCRRARHRHDAPNVVEPDRAQRHDHTGLGAASQRPDGGTPGRDRPRVATAAASGLTASRIPIGALLTSFSAFPHAVTSGPQLTLDGTDVATRLPDDHDIVLVHTEAVTYELPWGEVPFLRMPDGSVVFDGAGALLAHVADGRLVMLVGD